MTQDSEQSRPKKRIRIPERRPPDGHEESEGSVVPSSDGSGLKLKSSFPAPSSRSETDVNRQQARAAGPTVPSGTSDGSASESGEKSLSSPAATGGKEERDRCLTFELETGELPSVLQFISADKRTGRLQFTIKNQPDAGSVFFRDGQIYLAKFLNYSGIEALSRVVNQDRVRAVFTYNKKSSEKNISLPTSSLLLEVLLRADELIAENASKKADAQPAGAAGQPAGAAGQPAGAAGQPAGAAGQPARAAGQPARAAGQPAGAAGQPAGADAQPAGADAQPAGADAQPVGADAQPARAAGDQATKLPSSGKGLEIHAKGGSLPPPAPKKSVRVPASRASTGASRETSSQDPGAVPPASERASSPPKSTKRFSGRLARLLVLAAVLVAGIFIVQKGIDGFKPSGTHGETTSGVDSSNNETIKHVQTWLSDAQKALEAQKYGKARRQVARILAVDPGHASALQLRDILDQKDPQGAVQQLSEIASEKLAETERFKGVAWSEPEVNRLGAVFESAKQLHAEEHVLQAIKTYRELVAGVDQLVAQDAARRIALQKKRESSQKALQARQDGREEFARELWSKAETAAQEADKYLAAKAFEKASASWIKAGDLYEQAADSSIDLYQVTQLTSKFERLRAASEKFDLSEQARVLDRQAMELATAGEACVRQEDWDQAKLNYRLAIGVQSKLLAVADEEGNRQRYDELMAKAQSFADLPDWNSARETYSAALTLHGFEKDAAALKGISQATKQLLIQKMKKAAAEGRWRDAKQTAEDVLARDSNDPAATEMIARALTHLVTSLTIVAEYNGNQVNGAKAVVSGQQGVQDLPVTVRLPVDQDYHIRVWAPPQEEIYFETHKTLYTAREIADDTLIVTLKALAPPEVGKAWRIPGAELNMASINPGGFTMGTRLHRDEQPIHKVAITHHFWMGVTEVTNHQYRIFLAATAYNGKDFANQDYLKHFAGSSAMSDEPSYPVCYISWKNAMAFCNWLTDRERKGNRLPEGYVYRLPTEAEWEYCARSSETPQGSEFSKVAWHRLNAQANQPVGQLSPNGAGLTDMLGNVWEMCYDNFVPYKGGFSKNPVGVAGGREEARRVMRGGSYKNPAELCRPGYRGDVFWMDAEANIGFRIVLAKRIENLQK